MKSFTLRTYELGQLWLCRSWLYFTNYSTSVIYVSMENLQKTYIIRLFCISAVLVHWFVYCFLLIILLILISFPLDDVLMLLGEIWCWSVLGLEPLNIHITRPDQQSQVCKPFYKELRLATRQVSPNKICIGQIHILVLFFAPRVFCFRVIQFFPVLIKPDISKFQFYPGW